jgi:hypothetical protein
LLKGGFERKALPLRRMQSPGNGSHLLKGFIRQGGDAAQRLFHGRGRLRGLGSYDFQLQPDGGQHLAHAGMQFPAKTLPLAFDLDDGLAAAPVPLLAGAGRKIPLDMLQPEVVPQQIALDEHQSGSLLLVPSIILRFVKLHAD